MPDLYAVIGNPIAHSKSPLIHAEFSRQTGQDMCYEAILVAANAFAATVSIFRRRGGKGMNVTVPFKLEACKISSHLTKRAHAAQAVNTLAFDANGILGDNTDGAGLMRDIVVNLEFPLIAKRVLLMGAGGAARGAILPLLEHNPSVLTIANRTKQKAHELQQQFSRYGNVVSGDYADVLGEKFDLVINATSASLNGKLPALPHGIFAGESLAYDMMYSSGYTPFLQFAKQQGAKRLADGIGMLVEQAAESFFLWRGIRPQTAPVIEMLRKFQA
ncbi:MAG: shikimate dehydrogenase [Pseudomonadota bacterium]|nr:shikimate dehydrogenase [Pseudomonadota bacterium]